MADIGLSFAPTQGNNGSMNRQPAQSPVMDAIRILSFRIPQTLGASAPIDPSLLAGQGGQGPSGINTAALIQAWLQRFFGANSAGALRGAAPAGPSTPSTPSVVYGITPSAPPSPVIQLPPPPVSYPSPPPPRTGPSNGAMVDLQGAS